MAQKIYNFIFISVCMWFSWAALRIVANDYEKDPNTTRLIAGFVTVIIFDVGFYFVYRRLNRNYKKKK